MMKYFREPKPIYSAATCSIISAIIFLSPFIFFVLYNPNTHGGFLYIGAQGVIGYAKLWIVCAPILALLLYFSFRMRKSLNKYNPSAGKTAKYAGLLGLSTLVFFTLIFFGSVPLAIIDPEITEETYNLLGLLVYFQSQSMDLAFDLFSFLLGILWLVLTMFVIIRLLGRSNYWVPLVLALMGVGIFVAIIGYQVLGVFLLVSIPFFGLVWDGIDLIFHKDLYA